MVSASRFISCASITLTLDPVTTISSSAPADARLLRGVVWVLLEASADVASAGAATDKAGLSAARADRTIKDDETIEDDSAKAARPRAGQNDLCCMEYLTLFHYVIRVN